MRWRRENAFCKAHEYLKHLHGEPEDLGALWELQILLLDEILFQEEKIRSLKTRLRKSEASLNSLSRAAAFFIQRRIEECRFWNYVWRCFGDGIAFSYMDRFALKQTLYNVENMGPKQGAGFIGGKDGLKHELDTVASALRDGIPALLTDLTNTVRHGDVCLMAGPDPILLEAKSGKIIDRRGKKQRKRIHSLHAFFREDFAQTLRGLKHVRRTEFTVPPVTYLQQINDCIEAANTVGYATGKPEEG
ncbi:MAG: hypothetical protein INR62_11540, partial [Rhodospirillales bacterium]|nr:hypothetical protein [Acetobacter sp.]